MLDLAAQQFTGAGQEKISTTLYYSIMQWAGYSREKKIAYLEFMLERDGLMESFRQRVSNLLSGKSWDEIKNQPLVLKTTASKLAAEFYPQIWSDTKAFNEIKLDEAEKEDDRVRETLDLVRRKAGKENILIILDEVGQYIAQRDDLILNLDGLAKNLKNIGKGKVWIIATAQQTLTEDDPIAALNSAKLFKLKDRFPVTIDLEANDIREICYRRLLSKSTAGEAALEKIFQNHGPQLRNYTELKNTRYFKTELTSESFSRLYPFLPHHFDILFDLLARLSKTSGGIGLRSAIKVIQDVLVDPSHLRPETQLLADEPVGRLATTEIFYDTLQRDIERSFHHIIEGVNKVLKVFGENSIHSQAAKSIAVLQSLEGFPVTAENIAALLHPAVDSPSLFESVKNGVNDLLAEPSIPLNEVDGRLRFMSAAVMDLEQERLKKTPRLADTRNIFNSTLQGIFTPSPTTRIHGTRTVGTGLKILIGSSQVSLIGEKEEIQTQIILVPETEYEAKREEMILESQQRQSRKIIYLLGRENKETENIPPEIYRCREIYNENRLKASDKEVEDYLRAQDQRATTLTGELETLIRKSLSGGSFIFRGKPKSVSELDENLIEATKKHLNQVALEVFEKYVEAPIQAEAGLAERFLKTEPIAKIASKDDPLSLVKRTGGGGIDLDNKAIISIKDYLEQHGQVDGRKLLDDLYAAPYGWSKDTTRYLIAAMLVGGLIKLRISGEDITVRGEVALNSLKNTVNFGKIGVSLREVRPSAENMIRAAERLVELTGESVLPLEEEISKKVIRHFPDFQQSYAPLAVQLEGFSLAGGERARGIQDNLAEIIKGDASDAANRLGGEICTLYEDLLWAREVKKVFDNGFAAIVKKANSLLMDIPVLTKAGIPFELIRETEENRTMLAGYLSRDDFYNYLPEIQNRISMIDEKIEQKTILLVKEQNEFLEAQKLGIQSSPNWSRLGQEDQARLARELDQLQVEAGKGLTGFRNLIGNQYYLNTLLQKIEKEIEKIIQTAKEDGTGKFFEKDLSHLPRIITSREQINVIISELESLKEQLQEFEEIILNWK